jgi:thiamine biosynthesis lipoprotein
MHRRYLYLALIALAVVFLFWQEPEPPQQVLTLGGKTMGTTYSVSMLSASPDMQLAGDIEARLEQLENIFSTWRNDSEISRFNAAGSTGWFGCSPELAHVVERSIHFHALTGGVFEVTLAPVIERWGFGRTDIATPPTDEELAGLMASVGTQALEARLSPPAIRKQKPDLSINLSAIAKGYAVDQLAELLEEHGIHNYMVEIGGEVRTGGSNRGRDWRVAIARPEPGTPQAQRVIELGEGAVATSGGYRNSIALLEKRYIHIIDPKSGKPVESRTASVTVIHDFSTMRADALATAFMAMPADAAIALADSVGVAAHLMLLDESGELTTRSSRAFQTYLQ